jgi:hypothetical protein
MVPVPPRVANGLPSIVVSRLTVQARPDSVIWNGWPPMVRVPVCGRVVEFGATEKDNVPEPVPVLPEVSEIQLGPDTVL